MRWRSQVVPLCDRAAVLQDSAEQNEWRLHSHLEYQLLAGVGERNQSGVLCRMKWHIWTKANDDGPDISRFLVEGK